MSKIYYLKLRANIVLNGDIDLAERARKLDFATLNPTPPGIRLSQMVGYSFTAARHFEEKT